MHNLLLLEEFYNKSINNLPCWIPEGIYFINLNLLYYFDLLHFQPNNQFKDPFLRRYFHIIESSEKITLVNHDFIIWIKPYQVDNVSVTYTLIALNQGEQMPRLEVVFIAKGIYNSSKFILKILEKFLVEIQETEAILSNFKQ